MRLLAPVDGSECSFQALSVAARIADGLDADLSVVHVTDYETESTDRIREDVAETLAGTAYADTELEVVVRGELDDPGASKAIGRHLLDLIEERGVDHVVVGRHGGGRLERMILGSCSQTLVKNAKIPVTVVS